MVSENNKWLDSRDNCNAIIETSENTLVVGCMGTTIPGTVKAIRAYAFEGCHGLTHIYIPEHLTEIGYNAFVDCPGLTSIMVSENNKWFDSRDNCNAIITTISNELTVGCKSTIIPNTVKSIGNFAFYKCTSLTEVEFPSSLRIIREKAFSGCSGLQNLVIPNTIGKVGISSFEGCSKLKTVVLDCWLDSLSQTFTDCTSLETVYINYQVKDFYFVFNGCDALKAIYVPAKKSAYYKRRLTHYANLIVEMAPKKR